MKIDYIKVKYSNYNDQVTIDAHLSKSKNGKYLMHYNVQKYYEITEKKSEINIKDSKKIENMLIHSKIPIITKGNLGLDGYHIEITFKNSGNEATYKWWVAPNSDWEPLEKMFKIISKYFPFEI